MKKIFLIVPLLLLSLQSCKKVEASEIEMISPEEMLDRMEKDDIQVLDVRSAREFDDAHLFKAKNIILSENNDNSLFFDTLAKDKPVVIYGKNKENTKKAIEILKEDGFEEVYELEGGIENWILVGGEVYK
ncbi:rhodanese-like domain-containing protein [Zunongwangia sp. SCSIO 43204]|uniref:Rhodanese-related sulfurtransferase n=1 Tax=Zunongwangia mangrovi TaxID=1334022 RepID=A0A1I1JQ96_9FLAO|nr:MULTISPECIES: rhodanese-like domain-containing protein [Zunongwangia]UAB84489.1 rhodanese-like domain-containing protein [Zunongwangia sp. SCSIO 43204]SFC50112.1 Rhodanese-related sulfurtransferase [Zunongwangia mangrovi]